MWPNGVKNRLYGVHRARAGGPPVVAAEIPYSYDTSMDRNRYRAAVDRHLRRLTRAGLIDPHTATEAKRDAMEAYAQAHQRSGRRGSAL